MPFSRLIDQTYSKAATLIPSPKQCMLMRWYVPQNLLNAIWISTRNWWQQRNWWRELKDYMKCHLCRARPHLGWAYSFGLWLVLNHFEQIKMLNTSVSIALWRYLDIRLSHAQCRANFALLTMWLKLTADSIFLPLVYSLCVWEGVHGLNCFVKYAIECHQLTLFFFLWWIAAEWRIHASVN